MAVRLTKSGLQSTADPFKKKQKVVENPVAEQPKEKPKVSQKIEFLGGTIGNRKVRVDGQELTQDEYNSYLNSQGGGNSASYEKLIAGRTPNVEKLIASDEAKRQAVADFEEEENIRKQAEFDFKKTQMIGEMTTKANAEKNAEALSQINQPIPTAPTEATPLSDTAVRVGTSAGSIIGGASAGATGGAIAGSAVGSVVPVIGTAIGGVAGAIIGGIGGGALAYYAKLSYDKKQDTKEAYNDFTNAKTRIGDVIADTSNKAVTPSQAVEYYRNQWSNVYQTRDRLIDLTETAVGRDLSKARDELADVEALIGDKFIYDQQLQQAILNPSPKYKPQTSTPIAG